LKIALLDCETTGLQYQTDKIIEIALIQIDAVKNEGNQVLVTEVCRYEGFEDPKMPLPDVIKKLTHISDEDLAGKSIDWPRVHDILEDSKWAVAHMAEFDRSFVEEKMGIIANLKWACSKRHINWERHGQQCNKLRHLAMEHGLTPTTSHRAMADVETLLSLLSNSPGAKLVDPEEGLPIYLSECIATARRPVSLLKVSTNYSEVCNQTIKTLGFRWSGAAKVWWAATFTDEVTSLLSGLKDMSLRTERGLPYFKSADTVDGVDETSPTFKQEFGLE